MRIINSFFVQSFSPSAAWMSDRWCSKQDVVGERDKRQKESEPRPGQLLRERSLTRLACKQLFLSIPLTPPPLMLVLGDDILEELVDRPADGCGGHLVDDPRLHAFEVSRQAAQPVHCPEGMGQA